MILPQELELVFEHTDGRLTADGGRTERHGSLNSYLDRSNGIYWEILIGF